MNFVIEAHVAEHRNNAKDLGKAVAEAERVENALITQVFRIASREAPLELVIKKNNRARFCNK